VLTRTYQGNAELLAEVCATDLFATLHMVDDSLNSDQNNLSKPSIHLLAALMRTCVSRTCLMAMMISIESI